MAITIERFELLPGPAPAEAPQGAASPAADGNTSPPPPLSRHDWLRAMRLELARAARVHAH